MTEISPDARRRFEELADTAAPWRVALALSESEFPDESRSLRLFAHELAASASRSGDNDAKTYLAERMVSAGRIELVNRLRSTAESGDFFGQLMLSGLLLADDPIEAAYWDEKAGRKSRLVLRKGQRFTGGDAVYFSELINGLSAGATAGVPFAQERMADYEYGEGRTSSAESWYRRAALVNRPTAQLSLYEMFRIEEPIQALVWLKESAEGGSPDAMVFLARYLQSRDWRSAKSWAQKATSVGGGEDAEAVLRQIEEARPTFFRRMRRLTVSIRTYAGMFVKNARTKLD